MLRFDREGFDLEFEVEEKGYAQFLCKIDLPVDSPTGGSTTAEALVKGRNRPKLKLKTSVADPDINITPDPDFARVFGFRYDFLIIFVDGLLFKDPDPGALKVPEPLDPDPQHWFTE